MTKNIKPLHDKVLIKRVENESTTSGGIIIPDSAQEKTQIGVVKAVGTGKINNDGSVRALNVKTGDKVLFGKFSGTDIKIDGQELLIIREDEILAIVE
ncbi:MAG: 10 kDa chaperonin [candidate division TM6 bacterium GW2011_GWF2_28_16]|nr:MAG: 10 kDa chaperonin [candidate division TM6 bacterium GW2011_GWF2_28_16]